MQQQEGWKIIIIKKNGGASTTRAQNCSASSRKPSPNDLGKDAPETCVSPQEAGSWSLFFHSRKDRGQMLPANEKCPRGDNRPRFLPALTPFCPVGTKCRPLPAPVCPVWMINCTVALVALPIAQAPLSNCLPWLYVLFCIHSIKM